MIRWRQVFKKYKGTIKMQLMFKNKSDAKTKLRHNPAVCQS